jgi:predicted site-specific integrase-resolvase
MAERLGFKTATILSWARQGRIPCRRDYSRPLFDPVAVRAAIDERARQREVACYG